MFKEILACALIPGMVGGITTPYVYINQFVIYNNITEINLAPYSKSHPRGYYAITAEINGDDEYIYIGYDNTSYFVENSVTSDSYRFNINGNVPNWEDYYNGYELGFSFDSLTDNWTDYWIDSISSDLQSLLFDDWNCTAIYGANDEYFLTDDEVNIYDCLLTYDWYYDYSISLQSYQLSKYANYNFEFSNNANGYVDIVNQDTLSGVDSYVYHDDTEYNISQIIFHFTSYTNLDYMRQIVLEGYPYADTLELITSRDLQANIESMQNELNSLRSANAQLQAIITNYERGYTLPNLMWVIAGTPWESFKNIWNVNLLGLNISGFITGLITALLIVWVVKKIFK